MLKLLRNMLALTTLSLPLAAMAIPRPIPKSIRIPNKEIHNFVTAVAVIKHYYIKPVSDDKLFTYAIRGMLTHLDPHSTYLNKDELKTLESTVTGKFVGIGIELTIQDGALKVVTPLEGTPADKAGIKPNDLIIKINNNLVQNLTLEKAISEIKGKRGTKVKLTIVRKGLNKPLIVDVKRDIIKVKMIRSKLYEDKYGYIRLAMFQGPVVKNLHLAVQKLKKESNGHLKGIILDLRNNPGGLLEASAGVVDTFLDSNKITGKFNHKIVYTQGRIKGADLTFKAHPGDMINGMPIVVLINGGSASASEIVSGSLQDYRRAIIMGTRSFGKGSVQTVVPVSPTSAIKITTALYHLPSGNVIQARGIIPDVIVPALEVSNKKEADLLTIDEANFQNHLANGNAKKDDSQLAQLKRRRQTEIKLAKDDYQLYEALMMLKGVSALKH